MTDRKPPGLSWESWIDRQIVEATEAGAFDDLEGHGKPIGDLDRPHDDDWWIRAKLAREDVLVTPPTIAIRHDRDESLQQAMVAPDEATVRSIVEELNERIRAVNRGATWGPPSSIGPLDIESIVERWRTTGRGAQPEPPEPVPSSPGDGRANDTAVRPRRAFWRRTFG
ncbi:MAG: DUF1992 domain-containing protein [Ilumatobacter sp.]